MFKLIYQDNPSDKDINQGTLVVFNLDPSVSNDDLLQIFGAYGEVKEVIRFSSFLFSLCFTKLLDLWSTSLRTIFLMVSGHYLKSVFFFI